MKYPFAGGCCKAAATAITSDCRERRRSGPAITSQGPWKLIEPGKGPKVNKSTNTEMGNGPRPQLFNVDDDPGETRNIASEHPERVKELAAKLETICSEGRSRP
jgi:hypothetical protein